MDWLIREDYKIWLTIFLSILAGLSGVVAICGFVVANHEDWEPIQFRRLRVPVLFFLLFVVAVVFLAFVPTFPGPVCSDKGC
jgi:uncharacterized BrkB/YihY/UPF0761 family membrane protein